MRSAIGSSQAQATIELWWERGKFLTIAYPKKPGCRRIKAVMRHQLDDLQRNLDAMDTLIGSDARLSLLMLDW